MAKITVRKRTRTKKSTNEKIKELQKNPNGGTVTRKVLKRKKVKVVS